MALTKEKKKEVLEELKGLFQKQKVIIFCGFQELKAQDIFELRVALKKIGANLKVAKKTLAEIACADAKINLKEDLCKNQLAIAFGMEDETSPLKTVYQFSKKNAQFEILGGYLEKEFLTQEKVLILAQIPPKEILLGQLCGLLKSPISGLTNVLSGNIKGLINVLAKAKA